MSASTSALRRGLHEARAMKLAMVLLIGCAPTPAPSPSDDDPGGKGDAPGDAAGAIWQPPPGTTWQWQLTGAIDTSIDAAMYDVDLFDASDAALAALHAAGRKVICYFSAGSREDWRPDAADYPAAALGAPLDDWPGERWVDTRSVAVRAVLRARLDRAVARGCDGVEPDNVDAYANANGLGLTAADQLDFNRFLAAEAHARLLSVGLKNDLGQIGELVGDFDWALDEQCFEFDECDDLAPFLAAGKAVFNAEYTGKASAICPQARARRLSTLLKHLDLGVARIACE